MTSKWYPASLVQTSARLRLFCLPFAGGGAAAYRMWQAQFPREIQVVPVMLPGRESRLSEPLAHSTTELVPQLVDALAPLLDRPYAFFGHSMGALLAFEATRLIRDRRLRLPEQLFLSSHRAPHLPDRGVQVHDLQGQAFRDALRDLGGTPQEVLDHEELMAIAEPILRADFELCETYRYTPDAPLDMPFAVYGGDADRDIPRDDLEPWRAHSTREVSVTLFPGHHLYINTQRDALIEAILRHLRKIISNGSS